jgi:hypothetical protein
MSEVECRKVIAAAPEDYAVLGVMWSAHFQDACAAFGMENALMTMMAIFECAKGAFIPQPSPKGWESRIQRVSGL